MCFWPVLLGWSFSGTPGATFGLDSGTLQQGCSDSPLSTPASLGSSRNRGGKSPNCPRVPRSRPGGMREATPIFRRTALTLAALWPQKRPLNCWGARAANAMMVPNHVCYYGVCFEGNTANAYLGGVVGLSSPRALVPSSSCGARGAGGG